MNIGSKDPSAKAKAASKAVSEVAGTGGRQTRKGGSTPWEELPTNRERRRDAILRRVANMLREQRLSAFTLAEVADELGMTKGNLYYYFKDKQDLVYQCHMRSMELSLRALKSSANAEQCPTEQLRTLLRRHVTAVVSEGFGGILQTDLENFSPEQRESYVRKRDEFERGLRSIIQAGVECGEFECANVKLAGFVILGAINWIPKWYKPQGSLSAEQISEQVTDQLLNGLVPRGRK